LSEPVTSSQSSQSQSDRASRGASYLELAIVFTALAVMMTAQLAATRMTFLLYHPLWLDECLTQLLATDPSFRHALAAIRGGVETNPPTLYFFLWPLARILGGDVVMLRGFAGASMLLALVGVYAICRRLFDRVPSIIGMLVLLPCQPARMVQPLSRARKTRLPKRHERGPCSEARSPELLPSDVGTVIVPREGPVLLSQTTACRSSAWRGRWRP